MYFKFPNPGRQSGSDEDVPKPKKPRLEKGKENVDEYTIMLQWFELCECLQRTLQNKGGKKRTHNKDT